MRRVLRIRLETSISVLEAKSKRCIEASNEITTRLSHTVAIKSKISFWQMKLLGVLVSSSQKWTVHSRTIAFQKRIEFDLAYSRILWISCRIMTYVWKNCNKKENIISMLPVNKFSCEFWKCEYVQVRLFGVYFRRGGGSHFFVTLPPKDYHLPQREYRQAFLQLCTIISTKVPSLGETTYAEPWPVLYLLTLRMQKWYVVNAWIWLCRRN